MATDADGDQLTFHLDRSDGDLFTVADDGILTFAGTSTAGDYAALIAVSDEFGAVLFTANVHVTEQPQSDFPSDAPSMVPSTTRSATPTETPVVATPAPSTTSPLPAPSAAPVVATTKKSECQTVICVVARLFIAVWQAFEEFLVRHEYGSY